MEGEDEALSAGGRSAQAEIASVPTGLAPGDLERDPRVVLSLLEPDQIVAAKGVALGQRTLSPGLRVVLWALRFYVVFMLVVVAIQVVRALRGGA